MIYSVYNAIGLISRVISCSGDMIQPQLVSGESYILGHSNDASQYIPDVNNPVITDKPVSNISIDKTTVDADQVDVVTLSNIPSNATIQVNSNVVSQAGSLASPVDTISFDLVGSYELIVSAFPYLDYQVTINAI